MSKPILRIHQPHNPEDDSHTPDSQLEQMWRDQGFDSSVETEESKMVAVPLSKVIPLLLDAVENQRVWLDDFSEDLINMNSDLYEILLAYQQVKGRKAA